MGVLVRNSSTKLVDRYHQQFGSKVTIAPDMSSGNMQIKSLTTEQLLDFGKSDLLQSTRYTAKVSILPDKLTLLDESEDMPGKSVMTGIDENGKKMSGPLHNPKTTLIGYDSQISVTTSLTANAKLLKVKHTPTEKRSVSLASSLPNSTT